MLHYKISLEHRQCSGILYKENIEDIQSFISTDVFMDRNPYLSTINMDNTSSQSSLELNHSLTHSLTHTI